MGGRAGAAYPALMPSTRTRLYAASTLALAIFFGSALSAQAAAPIAHSAKSPAEVAAYWTKDRMRVALPRDTMSSNSSHGTAGKPRG